MNITYDRHGAEERLMEKQKMNRIGNIVMRLMRLWIC